MLKKNVYQNVIILGKSPSWSIGSFEQSRDGDHVISCPISVAAGEAVRGEPLNHWMVVRDSSYPFTGKIKRYQTLFGFTAWHYWNQVASKPATRSWVLITKNGTRQEHWRAHFGTLWLSCGSAMDARRLELQQQLGLGVCCWWWLAAISKVQAGQWFIAGHFKVNSWNRGSQPIVKQQRPALISCGSQWIVVFTIG